jgi:hypothetical protein
MVLLTSSYDMLGVDHASVRIADSQLHADMSGFLGMVSVSGGDELL